MPDRTSHSQPSTAPALAASPAVYPLDDFYAQAGRPLPTVEIIPGESMPEPYRQLLVHHHDMTTTLERYYGARVHLHVIRHQQRDDFYFREVVLKLDGTNQPVEFGAIKMNLALFPPAARRDILEERLPLGTILHQQSIAHLSRPKAFLRLLSDEFINHALSLQGRLPLYGRRNTLTDLVHRPLAEIVEILPPAPEAATDASTTATGTAHTVPIPAKPF